MVVITPVRLSKCLFPLLLVLCVFVWFTITYTNVQVLTIATQPRPHRKMLRGDTENETFHTTEFQTLLETDTTTEDFDHTPELSMHVTDHGLNDRDDTTLREMYKTTLRQMDATEVELLKESADNETMDVAVEESRPNTTTDGYSEQSTSERNSDATSTATTTIKANQTIGLVQKDTLTYPLTSNTTEVKSGLDVVLPGLNYSTIRATLVLLVTYARSGSTWLGAITSRAPRSFYAYEPFKGLIKEGYYKENTICFNNDTCRQPRMLTESHEFAIRQLSYIFTCQLYSTHAKVKSVFANTLYSDSVGTYKECMNRNSRTVLGKAKCLNEMAKSCQNSDFRIVKAIRISMDLVKILMDIFPTLKVIHLVRDPRAIANSRRAADKTFRMSRQPESHARDMCNRMYTDLQVGSDIRRKYPNRTTLVMYEALAERPEEGAEFVYTFLNSTITPKMKAWVYNSSHATKNSNYFGVARKNSTSSATHWRLQLQLQQVLSIDKYCFKLFSITGYLPLTSERDLRNEHLPSRSQKLTFGFV